MAGSDGTAELEVNEVPDLSLEGAAAAAPKCQVEETCTLATEMSCKYEMDPTASAAGDYREGEMLVVLSNHDKELYIANGNQVEEMPIVNEQIGIDLCHNQHEQDFVAVGNKDGSIVHSDELPTVAIGSKDDEGHSLVYSDELPTVAVEQKDDGDRSLVYSDELPAVAVRNKEDEDGSIAYSDELPTVAVRNKEDEDHSIYFSDELPTVAIGNKEEEDRSIAYSDELPTVAVRNKEDEDHSIDFSDELPTVAIGNKEEEDRSIAYSDELPTVAIGNKEDEDRFIAYSDELPTVAVGNKEDGDRSLFYSELPTVVIENKDTLDELETIDVSVLTADSSPATRENKDEQLTDVTDSMQRQSPSIESSEEQAFVASHIEGKYVVVSNQDEQVPAFTDHQDELHSVAIGNKDINLFSGDGEHFRDQQTIEDSGQMLTNSAILEASFSSHDDCADIGDINIAVDMFLLVDDTKPDVDPTNLLNHSSNYHTPKTVDQPQCLSDVQFSLSETVTVSHSPLGGGANYVIDVGDKPSEESSRPLTGTGDVIGDSQPATGGDSDAVVVDPMVDMDAECENIVIMSISDAKHDSEDEEFGFEIAQYKDNGLPHSGSGEHVSPPKVVDLEKPKKDEDVFVPVTGDLAPRSSTSLTEQDEPTKSKALKEAEEAWATVDDMTTGFGAGGDFAVAKRPVTVLVSYSDAIKTLCQSDIIKYKPHIRTSVTRRGFQALKYIFCGPPRLHEDLVPDRDLAFCMAACPFWNDNVLHLQVLQTIYKKLTGSRFDCPRYGTHWEQIGFQGTDPATDLRGVGFLALLHLLYALTTPKVTHIIRDIYKISQNEVQNFPLCIMSINMTRVAVEALREDCLNKWCNHSNQVIPVLNEFYLGTFLRMYHIWKHEGKTIKDSGFVLQDVEKFVKKHPAMVLRNLEVYAQTHAQSPPSPQQSPPSPPNVTVSPLSPDELDEYINEPYPSPSELDVMKTDEDVSNKNFFAVCKNNDTENLGNLI